jgi:GT2 family glycosyltransferase
MRPISTALMNNIDVEHLHTHAMRQCSIIIPVYNRAELTRQCLDNLLGTGSTCVDCEIIVVDDASTDATPQVLSLYDGRIRTITHTQNKGFAAACNQGAAIASGNYLIFLNNDTIPTEGWLEALLRCVHSDPEIAVAGSKLLFPNNTVQHAGVVICQDGTPRHIYAGFPTDHPAVNKLRRFQAVTAACALVRRSAFEEVGRFDTAFCNGYEDVDLCLRLGQRGYRVVYCPDSVLYHLESISRERQSRRQHENYLYYQGRWAGRVQPDDLRFYIEDGLMQVRYDDGYPIQLNVSPLLASIDTDDRARQADRLLAARARQVSDLLRENIRLNLVLRELAQSAHMPSDARSRDRANIRTVALAEPRIVCRGEMRWMADEPSGTRISILIPVKNGAARLRQLLPRIRSQQTRDSIEIVAIDSGSSDDTVDVLHQFGATVVSIAPEAFNHGLTRNLAAQYANGEILVFVNQRTLPADNEWLANLVAPLRDDQQLAGVCSRVLPGDDADVLTAYDGARDLHASSERQWRTIVDRDAYQTLSPSALRRLINFHTISAAVRAAVFEAIPFRAVTMGEDIVWAKEVLEAGYAIQHEPTSVVYHTHNYSLLELMQRNFDDGRVNHAVVGREIADHEVFPRIASSVQDDRRYLEQAGLSADARADWEMISAVRRTAQALGQWLGANYDLASGDLLEVLSLTERIKAGVPSELAETWKV